MVRVSVARRSCHRRRQSAPEMTGAFTYVRGATAPFAIINLAATRMLYRSQRHNHNSCEGLYSSELPAMI
jgi:hypothetical protein